MEVGMATTMALVVMVCELLIFCMTYYRTTFFPVLFVQCFKHDICLVILFLHLQKTCITNDMTAAQTAMVEVVVMEVAVVVEEDMVVEDKAMETAVADMVVEDTVVVVAAAAAVVMTTITTAVEALVSTHFECKWHL